MINNSQTEQILFIGLTIDNLLLRIEQILDTKFGDMRRVPQENESDYITRKEAASLLKVSLPTLHDWTKMGWLQSYKLGNRVLYRKAEVADALQSVQPYKHKKGGRP